MKASGEAVEASGKSRGAEPVGGEVCPRTAGVVDHTRPGEVDDTKGLSLGQRQFLEFAFALIGFRLAVRCAGQLIVRLKRAGGPMSKTIVLVCRAQELHRADGEQHEEQPMPG